MGGALEFKGALELSKDLRKKAKQVELVRAIVKQNGSEMQQKAMRTVPVRTGELKRSIELNIEDDGMTARVTAGKDYAPYVEWGTRYMTAQPFMRPAFKAQVPRFKTHLAKVMK